MKLFLENRAHRHELNIFQRNVQEDIGSTVQFCTS